MLFSTSTPIKPDFTMSLGIDPDQIVEEIEKFESNGGTGELSSQLEEYLKFVARTGDPLLPWNIIKNIIKYKLSKTISEFYELFGGEDVIESANTPPFAFVPTRTKILQHFDTFVGAPFTIQRLCELLVDPKRHYTRTDKFLRGLEKNIYVVSFVEPGQSTQPRDISEDGVSNGLQEDSPEHSGSAGLESRKGFGGVEARQNDGQDILSEGCSEDRVNGNGTLIANGIEDCSSSSSSSPSSSTSSSPTPDEEVRDHSIGPAPKRARLDLSPERDRSVNSEDYEDMAGLANSSSSTCPRLSSRPCDPGETSEMSSEDGPSPKQPSPEEEKASPQGEDESPRESETSVDDFVEENKISTESDKEMVIPEPAEADGSVSENATQEKSPETRSDLDVVVQSSNDGPSDMEVETHSSSNHDTSPDSVQDSVDEAAAELRKNVRESGCEATALNNEERVSETSEQLLPVAKKSEEEMDMSEADSTCSQGSQAPSEPATDQEVHDCPQTPEEPSPLDSTSEPAPSSGMNSGSEETSVDSVMPDTPSNSTTPEPLDVPSQSKDDLETCSSSNT